LFEKILPLPYSYSDFEVPQFQYGINKLMKFVLSETLLAACGFSGKSLENLKEGCFWQIRPKGYYFEAKPLRGVIR
jgi:hypothetical protein